MAKVDSQLPRGLFGRVIRRLKLEEQLLLIRRNLGMFVGLLVFFALWSVLAIIGFHAVWQESNFEAYWSLLASDPAVALKYWHSFSLSVLESIPAEAVLWVTVSMAFLMLCVRFVGVCYQRWLTLAGQTRKQKYGAR